MRFRGVGQVERAFWCALVAVVWLCFAAPAFAYTFGPNVRQTGAEEVVFDWSTMRCEDNNAPDAAARAFRDAHDRVQLTISRFVNYRMIGPSLDNLNSDCLVTMSSDY